MSEHVLQVVDIERLARYRSAVAAGAMEIARGIIADAEAQADAAVLAHARRLGDLREGEPVLHDRAALDRALRDVGTEARGVLERTAGRIARFARAQLGCLRSLDVEIEGGRAGHTLEPVQRAGCYAPGGRYPLPSSVLMTVIPARVAGVSEVWVASPRPTPLTMAAAAAAGADGLLAVGGAQGVAALALGLCGAPACDVIVGPGNAYVTAAKLVVSDRVSIDMLAGPSELVVLADETADAATIAADLLAQAEHDEDALAVLVTTDASLVERVEAELRAKLQTLPTAGTARAALRHGGALVAASLDEAIELCDRLAPEHLEVLTRDADGVARRVRHAGAVFIGPASAEVLGDYGAGPNHVLPTGGTARSRAGLSVLTFLRARTWLRMDETAGDSVIRDAIALARMEGLEAHARAAARRVRGG